MTVDLPSSSPLHGKTAVQAKLKEIGLPSLLVFPGPFADCECRPLPHKRKTNAC